jgi:hypothetical protein
MFGLFRKKVRYVILLGILASFVKVTHAQDLASFHSISKVKSHVEASVKKGNPTIVMQELVIVPNDVLDSLKNAGIKEANEKNYDKAVLEVKLMKKYCDETGLNSNTLGNYARKVILEIVHDANTLRHRGDVKSASIVFGKALEAAQIGEPRWSKKIKGFISGDSSEQLALNK